MLGAQFTPAYNQMYDLDAQKTVFTAAINGNNKALAKFLYPALLAAFESTHADFIPELKDYLLRLAHNIAPHCQVGTMIYLCSLHYENLRVLSLEKEQYIRLMIETADQATFLYFLNTSNVTLNDLAPHLDDMTEFKLREIQNLFAEQREHQVPQNANRHGGG